MNLYTPVEVLRNYAAAGRVKAMRRAPQMFVLAVIAGMLIALGGVTASTASFSAATPSASRLISGLVFPFGLAIIILIGAELFTGNVLIVLSVLDRQTTVAKMLRNWVIVYLGNVTGGILTAAVCVFFGQQNYSNYQLGAYTLGVAAAKCAIPAGNGFVLGIFCNMLVCIAVLCSLTAKDTAGRILGAYLPVAFFVICGFEHCIANAYYIPAGLFLKTLSAFADTAVDTSALTWGSFILRNMLPVTAGNIAGGLLIAMGLWFSTGEKSALSTSKKKKVTK